MREEDMLSILKDVYDPLREEAPAQEPVQSCIQSEAVLGLIEFLKTHGVPYGIRIVDYKGIPVLKFVPGLRRYPEDRWRVALAAERVFWNAFSDLRELMRKELIKLPCVTGPSQDPESHGSEQPEFWLLA